jgi:hypothetical protein
VLLLNQDRTHNLCSDLHLGRLVARNVAPLSIQETPLRSLRFGRPLDAIAITNGRDLRSATSHHDPQRHDLDAAFPRPVGEEPEVRLLEELCELLAGLRLDLEGRILADVAQLDAPPRLVDLLSDAFLLER